MAAVAVISPPGQQPLIARVASILQANKMGGQFPLFLGAEGRHFFLELLDGHDHRKLHTGRRKVNAFQTLGVIGDYRCGRECKRAMSGWEAVDDDASEDYQIGSLDKVD